MWGWSLKLSQSWTRNVHSLAGSVPSKESGSRTFDWEPSPWCRTFLTSAAMASARLFSIPCSGSSGLSWGSSGPSLSGSSSGSPFPAPSLSLEPSSLGAPLMEPRGSVSVVLLELHLGVVCAGMCAPNAMPGISCVTSNRTSHCLSRHVSERVESMSSNILLKPV